MAVAPHPPLREFYGDEKRERYVRDIFDETAPWYDWTVRFMSMGSGDWYRREALKRAGLKASDRMLDLATGTGVVARTALDLTRSIITSDASVGMLRAGKVALPKSNNLAEQLPFRDASFDLITIGFALRHFADLAAVFAECRRVLRPGGRLLILEITTPESRAGRAFLGAYMGAFVPLAVRIRTRSARAAQLFRYYWATTRDCVRPDVILQTMRDAGFTSAERHVELGVFSEYLGSR